MASSDARHQTIFTRLKLRHLRLIEAIAEAQSISGAAAKLHITQPAVSKGLREIEGVLGVRIFERGPNGVALTPYGRAVVTHGKVIQSEIRHVSDEIVALRSGTSGTVTIGALLVSLPLLLPEALRLLRDRKVEASVRIVEGSQETLLSQLRGGDIDFLVGRLVPLDKTLRLAQEVLYYEPIVVVAGARHRLAKKSKVNYEDLAQAEWVFPPAASAVHGSVMQLFTQFGLSKPSGYIEATSYLLVRALLMGSGMVAALPASVVADDVKSGRLRALGIRFPQEALAVGITTSLDKSPSAVGTHMVHCLRDVAKRLAAKL
jgi:DNA-binding transcriptional LysR family regulator